MTPNNGTYVTVMFKRTDANQFDIVYTMLGGMVSSRINNLAYFATGDNDPSRTYALGVVTLATDIRLLTDTPQILANLAGVIVCLPGTLTDNQSRLLISDGDRLRHWESQILITDMARALPFFPERIRLVSHNDVLQHAGLSKHRFITPEHILEYHVATAHRAD